MGDSLAQAIDHVSEEDFTTEIWKDVWLALLAIWEAGNVPDLISVKKHFDTNAKHVDIDSLVDMAESGGLPANTEYLAKELAETTRRRKLGLACDQIQECIASDYRNVTDIVEDVQETLSGITKRDLGETQSIRGPVKDLYMDILTPESGSESVIPTGLHEIDHILSGGLRGGQLVIIGARPSMGKSALMLRMADYMCTELSLPGHVVSLEMMSRSISQRILSMSSGVDADKIRRHLLGYKNVLTPTDKIALRNAVARHENTGMTISDVTRVTPQKFRRIVKHQVKTRQAQVIFLDYLQIMHMPGKGDRFEKVSDCSRMLKELALEMNVPIVCLVQLNRAQETQADKRPKMSNIRESGSIEQDADIVALLHREAYYHKGDNQWLLENEAYVNMAELILDKQREGATGVIPLHYHAPTTRFSNWQNQDAYNVGA